tara:strand:+ start:259 stop:471 length:213 start_codon:yes stop_codon:yes gene_type:complete
LYIIKINGKNIGKNVKGNNKSSIIVNASKIYNITFNDRFKDENIQNTKDIKAYIKVEKFANMRLMVSIIL